MQQGDCGSSGAEPVAALVDPRIAYLPAGNSDLGRRAVDLAFDAGLDLDDWQAFCLEESLRVRPDGRWSAFEFGSCVPRQNGKGGIIEARLLAALYLTESNLSIYSAHNFDTSLEHLRRMEYLITETPRLSKHLTTNKAGTVNGIKYQHGTEGIDLKGDRRLRFRTRTKGGGRGFACDGVLVLDEAMVISEAMFGALFPIMSGKTLEKPGPQIWYAGSAVDQVIHEHGVVFARVRERALAEKGERLGYLEWSVDEDDPSQVPDRVLSDKAAWAQANPALGIRIAADYIEQTEFDAMDRRTFAVERLGIGDWPRTDHTTTVLDLKLWAECEDGMSQVQDPVCLAFDVSPDRFSSVAVAGRRADGLAHIEVIASRRGTSWVAEYVAERVQRHRPQVVVCDAYGPAASLIPALENMSIEVQAMTSSEHGRACGQFVDQVEAGTLRYRPDDVLANAVKAAQTRPLGDAWAWSRKGSSGNISPLVACTLALSAALTQPERRPMLVLPTAS